MVMLTRSSAQRARSASIGCSAHILAGLPPSPATTVIQHARRGGKPSPWLTELLKRKPPKLAAVALANKMARIAWKLMVTGENYAAKAAPATLPDAA
jgi:transposase